MTSVPSSRLYPFTRHTPGKVYVVSYRTRPGGKLDSITYRQRPAAERHRDRLVAQGYATEVKVGIVSSWTVTVTAPTVNAGCGTP